MFLPGLGRASGAWLSLPLFLSIAGLPPFAGWFLKLDLMNLLIATCPLILLIVFLLASLFLTANYLSLPIEHNFSRSRSTITFLPFPTLSPLLAAIILFWAVI